MQDAKEEVRARLNIEDIVGEYVQLKRAGRNFKGLSPFTSERTPSFVVSPDKHIWHDFSSGQGGDIFSFVMKVEGLDFRAALEHLARKAGVDLSVYQSAQSGELAQKRKRLLEAHKMAAQYYQQSLVRNEHAVQYVFGKRKLSKQIVQDFQIGYAPTQGDALMQFLTRKGFSRAELADAGLTNRFGGDLFRGRMMVPLMDGGGQVIGFTARIIEDDPKAPKYLNTPQTLLYDKSRHVFGLSQAKESIRKSDYSVIVEGNLDVVSSHQVAIQPVVATAGTAMTEYHLKALSRLSGNVKLAFDGDKAGIAATERAIPIAQTVGVELSIVTLPGDAKDPDELIQQDPKLWQQAIDSSRPAVDWILEQYQTREDMSSAAGKRAYTSAGLRLVRTLTDPVDQDHYMQHMARVTQTSPEALMAKLRQLDTPDETPVLKRVAPQQAAQPDEARYQDAALALILTDEAARDNLKAYDISLFAGEQRQAVAAYAQTLENNLEDVPAPLQNHADYVKMLLLQAETRYATWESRDRATEAARVLMRMKKEHNDRKQIVLNEQIASAQANGNEAEVQRILMELDKLIKEKR